MLMPRPEAVLTLDRTPADVSGVTPVGAAGAMLHYVGGGGGPVCYSPCLAVGAVDSGFPGPGCVDHALAFLQDFLPRSYVDAGIEESLDELFTVQCRH